MAVTETASERYFAVVQGELAKERAATMRKAGDRLEEASLRCAALLERLDATGGPEIGAPPVAGDLLVEYRAARRAFLEARDRLCLQREAIGLHDHRWVDRIYPLPPTR